MEVLVPSSHQCITVLLCVTAVVWVLRGQSVGTHTSANISFRVPSDVIESNSSLCGFLTFTRELKNVVAEAEPRYDMVTVPILLAQPRILAEGSVSQRRNLLQSFSDGGGSNPNQSFPSTSSSALHSPFMLYPLIVRYIELYDVLDSKSINPIFGTNLVRRDRIYEATKGDGYLPTKDIYSPLLWIDDLFIPAKHTYPLRSASNRIKNDTPSDHSTPNMFMTLELQFAPTSLLHFGIKRVIQTNIRLIRDLAGDNVLDELRYWFSEDRVFMMVATQVVGWLHIILEYMAFKDDYQFYKVRNVLLLFSTKLFSKLN